MDTTTHIFSKEWTEKIDMCTHLEGTEQELSLIVELVELTRCLQEIYQWYQIVKYNLDLLKKSYTGDDYVGVNANVIGLLSAGKNFVELMELCMKNSYGKTSEEYKKFLEECIRKEYDGNFNYRLLVRLRNFTQHNHIPISRSRNSFCFDLEQIYHTPHYSFNNSIQKEAEEFMKEIREKYQSSLTLSIPLTVTYYICSVYKIFISFLQRIRPILIDKETEIKKLVTEFPDLIEHLEMPELNGWLFYKISEYPNIMQCIALNEKPIELLSKWLNDVVENHRLEKQSMKNMQIASTPV